MKNKTKVIIIVLLSIVLLCSLLYMLMPIISNYRFLEGRFDEPFIIKWINSALLNRLIQIIAIVIAAALVAASTLVFQTITHNRIITPSVLGFDSIYILIQTLVVAGIGLTLPGILNNYMPLILSSVVMLVVILAMQKLVFTKHKSNIILLLLLGMVISSFARSLTTTIQSFMDLDDLLSIHGLTSVSIVNINTGYVFIALPIAVLLVFLMFKDNHIYDVLQLGEKESIHLGIDYNKQVKKSLIIVTLCTILATTLVGPLSFLGLLVVNLAKEMTKKYQHKLLFLVSILLAIITIITGQVIVELLQYSTTVTTLISLIGGIYMIYMIIKENRDDKN